MGGKFRLLYASICVSCLYILKLQYAHLMSDVFRWYSKAGGGYRGINDSLIFHFSEKQRDLRKVHYNVNICSILGIVRMGGLFCYFLNLAICLKWFVIKIIHGWLGISLVEKDWKFICRQKAAKESRRTQRKYFQKKLQIIWCYLFSVSEKGLGEEQEE